MRRFFATFLCIIPIAHLGSAFASLDNKTCSSGSQECRSKSLVVDLEKLKESVLSGRVYQHENFLNEEEIQILVDDIDRLTREKKMMPSGLSNTNKGGNQQFGESDRTTCPVPWWVDSLQGNTLTFGTDSDEDSAVLNRVSNKIQDLRHCVASVLKRPTMKEAAYEHECYYSRSTVGASLKRHMDERHEETKGPRGWIQPSRRSVSWLIYLSDANIQGGELRSLVKKNFDSDQLEKITLRCITKCKDSEARISDDGRMTYQEPLFLCEELSGIIPTDSKLKEKETSHYLILLILITF